MATSGPRRCPRSRRWCRSGKANKPCSPACCRTVRRCTVCDRDGLYRRCPEPVQAASPSSRSRRTTAGCRRRAGVIGRRADVVQPGPRSWCGLPTTARTRTTGCRRSTPILRADCGRGSPGRGGAGTSPRWRGRTGRRASSAGRGRSRPGRQQRAGAPGRARTAEIAPIEDHHPAQDQLSALLAESGQIVLSSPEFLRGIRLEHFRNHAADRSAAVGFNGLHIADQDLAGLFNLRLLVVRQRFEG